MARTAVYLETGKTWTFASAVDWPGWSRRGKGEAVALETLADYLPRYAAAAGEPISSDFEVIGSLPGTATTDFGAPDVIGDWDRSPVDAGEGARLAGPLERIWSTFDAVAAASAAELLKGPRGGGRDRDAIVEHVREAERAYARKFELRIAPRTPWLEQRAEIAAAVRAGSTPAERWPLRYTVRRIAWHVLDHAWEIEDKQPA